jgi:metal-sulfur cluster biosynthetic enzyme
MLTEELVYQKLKEILDPELHINIVDLGLIYDVKVENKDVFVLATLTTPACPFGLVIEKKIREKIEKIKGVGVIELKFTFDPPWDFSKASEEVKSQLGVV